MRRLPTLTWLVSEVDQCIMARPAKSVDTQPRIIPHSRPAAMPSVKPAGQWGTGTSSIPAPYSFMPHQLSFWHESQTPINSSHTLPMLDDAELQRMSESNQGNAVRAVNGSTGQHTTPIAV